MRRIFTILISLLILSAIGMTAFASDVSMTVNNNKVTVENAPKDSTLFTVSYKDGKITSVSMVTGEGAINTDISSQKINSDIVKAFLWDLKSIKPLTEAKTVNENSEQAEKEMVLKIDGQAVPVTWEDNESVEELKNQAEQGTITVQMSKYGGFEQVGSLGRTYPSNDTRITTQNGDIVLYSSNQIVMFYGSNTWAYTRLGKVNLPENEVTGLLENENVTLTIDIKKDHGISDKKLNSGYTMPVLGLGTWTQDDETTANSVYCALKNGYRLIDTAQYYGNEAGVGEGVRKAIGEGIVKREDVFITSKVMPTNYNNAYSSIAQSNEKIGLGYIDLMLIHQSGSNDKQVYRALEQAVKDGTVHSIGISNYYTKAEFDRITEDAEIMPAVVQNENHPFYQNTEFQEYVKQYGTVVESYYPLGGRGHTQDLLGNETINEIAKAHNKTAAQIILRWHVQSGYVTIPGSSNPNHIAENIDIFDFELTDGEMQKMKALNTGNRYENW